MVGGPAIEAAARFRLARSPHRQLAAKSHHQESLSSPGFQCEVFPCSSQIPPCLEDACGVIFERESAGEPASADGKPHGTSGSIQGLGYLLTALRRQRLASDKLVLQLATFLRSHDLFLELSVRTPRTPRTLTANQVRHSGKQSTDGR